MLRLAPSVTTRPLVTGFAVALVLSGTAVFAVVHSGCQDPGAYEPHDGIVELIGGCVQPGDLRITQQGTPTVPQPVQLPEDPNVVP